MASVPTRGSVPLTRRHLLRAVGTAAFGIVGTGSASAQGTPAPAQPPAVPGATDNLIERQVELTLPGGRCNGLFVHGAAGGRQPGLLIIPEPTGLTQHVTRIARRFARGGYAVFVPSFVTLYGPGDDRAARTRLTTMGPPQMAVVIRAAIDHLAGQPFCSGAVGVLAFAWGGPGLAAIAAEPGPVRAMVLCYVVPPTAEQIPSLKVPIQFHYAGLDERTSSLVEPTEKRLMGYSKVYEQYVYDGVSVSFMNDGAERRYDEAAAGQAFDRMEFFLARHVKGR